MLIVGAVLLLALSVAAVIGMLFSLLFGSERGVNP